MANKKMWLGMLALVLAFGLTLAGCDTGNGDNGGGLDPRLVGTWVTGDAELALRANNTYEVTIYFFGTRIPMERGGFTIEGNNFTMTTTDVHGDSLNIEMGMGIGPDGIFDSRWYSRAQYREAALVIGPELGYTGADLEEVIEEGIANMFFTNTGTFSIVGDALTLTGPNFGYMTFTRQ